MLILVRTRASVLMQRARDMKKQTSPACRLQEPRVLRPLPFSLVMLAHILLLVAVTCLVGISRSRGGFVTLSGTTMETFSQTFRTNLSILWTTLPSVVVQILGFLRGTVADDAAAREPFTHLQSAAPATKSGAPRSSKRICREVLLGREPDGGGNGRATMLADYRYMNGVNRWFLTIRNQHWHLAVALCISFFMKILLAPLAASLVTVETAIYSQPISADYPVSLNTSDTFDGQPGDEWIRALSAASSEIVYGARSPPWTSDTGAFQPFKPTVSSLPTSFEVTAPSLAYSASLDCRNLQSADYQINYDDRAAYFAKAWLTTEDRGCALNQSFNIRTDPALAVAGLFEASNVLRCNDTSAPSRMFFIAATAFNQTRPRLDQVNAFSCITTYTTVEGNLTASWREPPPNPGTSTPESVSFTPTSPPALIRPASALVLENGFLAYGKPLNSITNNAFASLIIDAAAAALPPSADPEERVLSALLNASVIHTATLRTFATVYRTAIARIAFQSVSHSQAPPVVTPSQPATLRARETRLVTRDWVAAVLIAVTVLSLLSTAWLALVCAHTPLPVARVPETLLSYTGLLLKGGGPDAAIAEMVRDVDAANGGGGAGEREDFVSLAGRRWAIEDATFSVSPETGRLCATGLRRRGARGEGEGEDVVKAANGTLGEGVGTEEGAKVEEPPKPGSVKVAVQEVEKG